MQAARKKWQVTNKSQPKLEKTKTASVTSVWLTSKPVESRRCQLTGRYPRSNPFRIILILTGDRPFITPTANRPGWRNNFSITPSARAGKKLSLKSDSFQSSNRRGSGHEKTFAHPDCSERCRADRPRGHAGHQRLRHARGQARAPARGGI